MLFILRQLRRLELRKRSGQYFLYAFGEIVLIVVGILIAVQINDWKDERKLEQQRSELIENLQKDFRTNQERLESSIQIIGQNDEDLVEFLTVISSGKDELSLEELQRMVDSGFRHEIFQPALGAWNAAISTGAVGLLDSPLLNELVAEFEQAIADFHRTDELSGELMFRGSFWEVRKRLGSLHNLVLDDYYRPQIFSRTVDQYQTFFTEPEVYAAFENMQWIYRNEHEILSAAKELTEKILNTLDEL